MSFLILPRRFNAQPQSAVQIDRSGIGSKARFVLLGTQPKEVITGTLRGGTAGTGSATPKGMGYALPAAVSTWSVSIPDIDPNVSGSFSFFWHGVLRDNNAQRILRYGTSSSGIGWSFATSAAGAGTVRAEIVSLWGLQGANSGAIAITDNTVHSIAAVYDDATGKIEWYFDGSSVTSVAWTRDPHSIDSTAMFSMFTADATKPHKMLTAHAYAGKLNRAEVRSLHENPWRIFKAPPRYLLAASATPPSSSTNFRSTLSMLGTRSGSRQVHR